MNNTTIKIPIAPLAFLAAGIYLLMNGHPVAGGWCIFGAIVTA